MRKEIEKIVKDLCKHNISKDEAIKELLNLHSVVGSFIGTHDTCEIVDNRNGKTLMFMPYGITDIRLKRNEAIHSYEESVLEISV